MDGQQLDLFHFNSPDSKSDVETSANSQSEAWSQATASPQTDSSNTIISKIIAHWRWSLLASALVVTGALALPSGTTAESETQPAEATAIRASPLPVEVMTLTAVDRYSVQREYTGEVQAARVSDLGFERSGKLVSLGVQAGDIVKTGQPIARLDSQNLEAQRQQLLAQEAQAKAVLQELENGPRSETIAAAQSRVKDLEDQLALQKIRQSRRENLYQQGAIAREDFDEVAFGTEALSDRLTAARSELQELRTGTRLEQVIAQQAVVAQINAQLMDLDITIEKSTLRVPYSGVIGDRIVNEGTVVSAGQAVVRLVEGASPEVEIGIPEDVASSLVLGSRTSVEIGGQSYSATLAALKPEIDPVTRTRPLVLRLETPALQNLQDVAPQQIARLKLEQTVLAQGYWLPITALVKGDRGLWSVYVAAETTDVNTSSIVQQRDIEVLHTEGERAFVRGTITEGERIIVSGVQRIVPEQRVIPNS